MEINIHLFSSGKKDQRKELVNTQRLLKGLEAIDEKMEECQKRQKVLENRVNDYALQVRILLYDPDVPPPYVLFLLPPLLPRHLSLLRLLSLSLPLSPSPSLHLPLPLLSRSRSRSPLSLSLCGEEEGKKGKRRGQEIDGVRAARRRPRTPYPPQSGSEKLTEAPSRPVVGACPICGQLQQLGRPFGSKLRRFERQEAAD